MAKDQALVDATETTAAQRTRRYPIRYRVGFYDVFPVVLLIVVVLSIILLNPRLLAGNFAEVKANAALTLILVAFGQTFPILTGGIDLSVGGILSVANSLAATQMTSDPANVLLWTVAILLFGCTAGALNGLVISKLEINPFITTLATWSIWSGVALLILESDGGRVAQPLANVVRADLLGIPGSLVIIGVLVAGWLWFRGTNTAKEIYAVGSNERGAVLSGTDVVKAKITAYALSGTFAALAGLYRTVQVGSGSPVAGDGLILPAVAAVVIGGTSLIGGRGGAAMSILGALILLFINDLVFFLGVKTFFTPMVQGLLLVVAVAINAVGYRASLRKEAQ